MEDTTFNYTTSKANWDLMVAALAEVYPNLAKDLAHQIPSTLKPESVFGVWVNEADWDLLATLEKLVK